MDDLVHILPRAIVSGLLKMRWGAEATARRIASTADAGVTIDKSVTIVNRCGALELMTADRTGREDRTFRSMTLSHWEGRRSLQRTSAAECGICAG